LQDENITQKHRLQLVNSQRHTNTKKFVANKRPTKRRFNSTKRRFEATKEPFGFPISLLRYGFVVIDKNLLPLPSYNS
jgi:hypothetical protein